MAPHFARGSVAFVTFVSMVSIVWNSWRIWVVTESEDGKLRCCSFREEMKERGLIVRWCTQVEELVRRAIDEGGSSDTDTKGFVRALVQRSHCTNGGTEEEIRLPPGHG
ncbi:hypothetical protein H6P81_013060 [Aristolochia fimbriata]|uniref:Uncharacterized protein n=1 Tax=Aristolochia fimbriata TaxID=158543 RepID=A0AAV7EDK9_ARIFI|nr:hypothetical protein H6P81_013060 [Aristolochia fimbriata]